MITRWKNGAAGGALPLAVVILVLTLSVGTSAATPGELLQKAIYTEETVGNLDEAMKLYEQVIAEADAGQEAAAQAQFRLAMCFLKKGDEPAAKAAFEKLIANYPKATALIAQARKHLPTGLQLLPAPWVSGERLVLEMTLPSGLDVGVRIFEVENTKHNGKDTVRCSSRELVTLTGGTAFSEVWCDPETFAPWESYWRHHALGVAEAVYGQDSVTIRYLKMGRELKLDFTPPVVDNEQAAELFRRLPWAVGYKTTLNIMPILTGNPLPLRIDCVAKETLDLPAGSFEAFKLQLSIGQTFWVSADEHRYLTKFAVGGVSADLVSIRQVKPGERDDVAGDGFSFSIPSSWVSYMPTSDPKNDQSSRVYLLDPRVDASSEVAVQPKSTLKKSERESSTTWTEEFIKEIRQKLPDFTVRHTDAAEGIVSLGGHPATVIVADYTDDGEPRSMIGVAVIGDEFAANLRMSAERSVFEKLRPDFESIVESFQLK